MGSARAGIKCKYANEIYLFINIPEYFIIFFMYIIYFYEFILPLYLHVFINQKEISFYTIHIKMVF